MASHYKMQLKLEADICSLLKEVYCKGLGLDSIKDSMDEISLTLEMLEIMKEKIAEIEAIGAAKH